MARYKVLFRESALKKDLRGIPKADVKRLIESIQSLAEEPRPPGVQKLSAKERYRIRQGRYRIVYSIQDAEQSVWIVKVGHRRNAYRE